MKARIIRIGNSRGIRIPKSFLERSGLEGEVELEVEAGAIIIRSSSSAREGWEDRFRSMAAEGDDALLDLSEARSGWDVEEWEW